MITEWNILEELDCEEVIEGYLDEAKNMGDENFYQECLADVKMARTLLTISKETGITLKNLCTIHSSDPAVITALADLAHEIRDFKQQLQQVSLEVKFTKDDAHYGVAARPVFSFSPVLQLH